MLDVRITIREPWPEKDRVVTGVYATATPCRVMLNSQAPEVSSSKTLGGNLDNFRPKKDSSKPRITQGRAGTASLWRGTDRIAAVTMPLGGDMTIPHKRAQSQCLWWVACCSTFSGCNVNVPPEAAHSHRPPPEQLFPTALQSERHAITLEASI